MVQLHSAVDLWSHITQTRIPGIKESKCMYVQQSAYSSVYIRDTMYNFGSENHLGGGSSEHFFLPVSCHCYFKFRCHVQL